MALSFCCFGFHGRWLWLLVFPLLLDETTAAQQHWMRKGSSTESLVAATGDITQQEPTAQDVRESVTSAFLLSQYVKDPGSVAASQFFGENMIEKHALTQTDMAKAAAGDTEAEGQRTRQKVTEAATAKAALTTTITTITTTPTITTNDITTMSTTAAVSSAAISPANRMAAAANISTTTIAVATTTETVATTTVVTSTTTITALTTAAIGTTARKLANESRTRPLRFVEVADCRTPEGYDFQVVNASVLDTAQESACSILKVRCGEAYCLTSWVPGVLPALPGGSARQGKCVATEKQCGVDCSSRQRVSDCSLESASSCLRKCVGSRNSDEDSSLCKSPCNFHVRDITCYAAPDAPAYEDAASRFTYCIGNHSEES
eukprot:TRINITY_DN31041_c0_g1_i1.p1 TRINITY_DN31041_c0_g1~~TRINITY_DN31041_c0_g1_i1.p1  ORF type:complete len:377 (+),score=51.93 TRINITY_DN31041_c0_g1_i1:49-1179(+)